MEKLWIIPLEHVLEIALPYLLIAFFQTKNPASAGFFGESIERIKR